MFGVNEVAHLSPPSFLIYSDMATESFNSSNLWNSCTTMSVNAVLDGTFTASIWEHVKRYVSLPLFAFVENNVDEASSKAIHPKKIVHSYYI